jgi:DNA helicase-2/ATP-dependent DNA helicase PcrA
MEFIPSKYQEDIFKHVKETNLNLAIKATAGSGKTTTLIEITKTLPKDKEFIFAAFNKSIVDELQSKLPSNVICKTLHSIGINCLMKHYHVHFKLNNYKTLIFVDQFLKEKRELEEFKLSKKEEFAYKFNILDIIDLMRMNLTPLEKPAIEELCLRYNITALNGELDDCISVFKLLSKYNKRFSKTHNVIDYTDMIYLIANNPAIKVDQYDVVLIDEGQDLNTAQQLFVERLIKPKGRLISMADPNQSIYGFAGADSDAYSKIIKRKNTKELPLSISYRCPVSVVNNAKLIYPIIEHAPNAEVGEVRKGVIEEITENDLVLCRNTLPLIVLYLKLLEKEIPAYILGKDIEKGITSILSKISHLTKDKALEKLDYFVNECESSLKLKGVSKPKLHPSYEELKQKITAIKIIMSKKVNMAQVEETFTKMFRNLKNAVRLMTIHRSKGLENDRVFLIEAYQGKKLMPSMYAEKPEELLQEKNLEFVALTRAKKSLIYIPNIN